MAMKHKEYWEKRFELLEDAQNKKTVEYFAELEKQYNKAALAVQDDVNRWYARYAVNNEISLQDAKKMLNATELEEFKWNVMDYIEKGRTLNYSDAWAKQLENASARWHISRLDSLKIQMQNHVEALYGNELDEVTEFMRNLYTEGYYHTAYEIQKGFNIGYDLMKLDKDKIDKVLSKPWAVDGSNFSSRIWKQKNQLVSELHNNLTQAIIRGQNPSVVTDMIADRFKVSKGRASALVMTESAYFASASDKDCFNDLGVERYEILATLDHSTSDICRSLDGKVFPMSEYKVGVTAPPFHVRCRTTTVPFFDDEFELDTTRAARDEGGRTYQVPASMKYEEWKNTFVDGGSKEGLMPYNLQFFAAKYGYKDITVDILKSTNKGNATVEELKEVVLGGNTYTVDGKHVVLRPSEKERHIAKVISNALGSNVQLHPQIMLPQNVPTPDYLVDGIGYDLKSVTGTSKNVLYNAIKGKGEQAKNFIFDISECPLSENSIYEQAERLYSSSHMLFLETTIIVKNDSILKILRRK